MGQFIDHNFTYHIALSDQSLHEKVEGNVSRLGLSYIDSDTEKTNICILDSELYHSNERYYKENYEICLQILYEQDHYKIDKLLCGGTNFILHSSFTIQELEDTISLILNYLTYKYQSQILQSLFDSAHNSIVITNKEGVIQYANKHFLEATGYENEEVLGGLPKLIYSGFHSKEFYQDLWDTISSGSVWNGFFVNKRKNGRMFYEEATISPIFNTLGESVNYLKIGKMVERERLLSQELTQEMKLAQELMAYILPLDYSDEMIRFTSKVKAYNHLGGDYVCFEQISESSYAMAIIDVVGHSTSAALIGLKAISVFQSVIYDNNLETSVSRVNIALNQINEVDISNIHYLSGIFMVINIKEKTISYINAGHPAFYVKQEDNLLKVESNHMLLGITSHKAFKVEVIPLNRVSYLFLYSDGLLENEKDQLKDSEERLEQALLNAENSDQAFMESVLDEMIGDGEYSDDITLCYIEVI